MNLLYEGTTACVWNGKSFFTLIYFFVQHCSASPTCLCDFSQTVTAYITVYMIQIINIFYRKGTRTFETYSLWFLHFYLLLLNLEANILSEQIEIIIFHFDQSYISSNNLSIQCHLSTVQSSIDIMLS